MGETMKKDEEKLLISPNELKRLISQQNFPAFGLGEHFNAENIVEIAKSQFPRLEAEVAIKREMETTRRLLIVVAAICLIVGASLIVFAPSGKEGVSYAIAAALVVLPLG